MYFIAFRGEFNPETSRAVQQLVHERGGFILMVTRTGQVVTLDDAQVPVVAKHSAVKSIGGVTLNPHGYAAERLQRIFAENLSRQLDLTKLNAQERPGALPRRTA
jgi:hypothetical protein